MLLLLVAVLCCGATARAIGPYCTSASSPVSTCSFTVAANQLIVVDYFNTSNAVTFTSGLGLTYTQVRCDQETTVGNPEYGCHVYAKTGSTSGSETITLGSASWLWVQVLSSSDVQTTATNPVDTTMSFEGTLTSCGATCYTMSAGNITTTAPNDFIDYISLMPNCTNFYATNPAPTAGSVTLIPEIESSQNSGALAGGGCWVMFSVICNPTCGDISNSYSMADIGGAGTYTVTAKFGAINFYTNDRVSLVAYKGVSSTPTPVRHRAQIVKNSPTRRQQPMLLGALLPILKTKHFMLTLHLCVVGYLTRQQPSGKEHKLESESA